MQVVVNRSTLTQTGTDVPVIAAYDDGVSVDANAHGSGTIVLSVPASAVQLKESGPILAGDWRALGKQQLISAEATRRINDAFPEYSQRNSATEINGYILQYGADSTKWPAAARDRKSEIDRCWNYVNAVRSKAGAMSTVPPDPTGDAVWPTRIPRFKTL